MSIQVALKNCPTYHVITGQQFPNKLRLILHHRLDDELVIVGSIEDTARRPGVAQLDQRLTSDGEHEILWFNAKLLTELAEGDRHEGGKLEVSIAVSWRGAWFVRSAFAVQGKKKKLP